MRAFLSVDSMRLHPLIGYRLPVSVRSYSSRACRIEIFPEDGFDFFMGSEVAYIVQLAKYFDLSVSVNPRENLVVIEVSDYYYRH